MIRPLFFAAMIVLGIIAARAVVETIAGPFSHTMRTIAEALP